MLFGVLLAASAIVALIHPEATFAGFADILRLRVPDDRDSLDGPGVCRAGLQRPVVAEPDQRHPDGWTGVLAIGEVRVVLQSACWNVSPRRDREVVPGLVEL